MLHVKYTKLSLLVFNSCLLGSFLFFSLPHKIAHSQTPTPESIIEETNTTNSSSAGDINSDSADSDFDTPAVDANVPAVNDTAADISTELESGSFNVTNSDGTTLEVNADTQQAVADVAADGGETTTTGGAKVSVTRTGTGLRRAVAIDVDVEGVGGITNGISEAIESGGTEIAVESERATVNIEFEQPNATLINSLKLASLPSNKSFKLKSDKMSELDSELLTVRVEAFDKATLETNSYKLTGEPEVVKSAAAAVAALSLGGASKANVDLASSMILNTKIQPEMLVNLMLNYQGLLSNFPLTEVESEPTQPVVNLVKLENSIEAHNQIITETEPEVFQALMSNGEFQLISATLSKLRNSL